jgi:signal transduction histidine kinase/ligand-binding sensor domain-containing protein
MYPQPPSAPLRLSQARKLNWVTVRTGGLEPVSRPLNMTANVPVPYDSSGFRPLPRPVRETPLDWNSLPETPFNLNHLLSKPLGFKTSVLASPALVRAAPLAAKSGTPLSVLDFGQAQGFHGKLVTGLLRDKNGLVWIASDVGLCRFDGEYIQTYIPGSASEIITGLTEDDRGRIWYIMQFGGIGMIDPVNGTISHSGVFSAPGNDVASMMKDDRGRIWVTNTTSGGVIIIDPETQTYRQLDQHTGLSGDVVPAALEDNHKNIWLTTIGGGVDMIDFKTGNIKCLKKTGGLSSDTLWSLGMDKTGRIWMAFPNGLDAIDADRGSIRQYTTTETANRFSFNLLPDNRNRIWMGTTQGVTLLDPVTERVRQIDQTQGLSGDVAVALLQDDAQRVWVGTAENGNTEGLSIIEQYGEMVHLLGRQSVSATFQDPDGKIWAGAGAGALGAGIQILDRRNNRIIHLNKRSGISNDFIQSFAEMGGDIGVTSNGGLDIIDVSHKKIEHIGRKEGLANDTIYSILRDNRGNLWLTGPSEGLDFIDSAKRTIKHAGMAEGLRDNDILDVKQDSRGLLWVATNTKGVDVIDPGNGTIRYLDNAPGLRDTCNRLLMPDKTGRMWIGTDKGIYVADAGQGTLVALTTAEGLSDNHIVSLSAYKDAVIAGTNHKVNIIGETPAGEWSVAVLDKSEGLHKETSSWNTDLVTQNGEFIWADNGITIINDIKADSDHPVTHITGIQVMSQFGYFGSRPGETEPEWQHGLRWDSVSGPYNLPVNLHIPHDRNYIQFQFAQAHWGRQDTVLYCYILEGVDKQWSAFTPNPFTENYLNLSPGVYTFKVCGKDRNGRWGKPASFRFTVMPPWWQTWWAYSLLILLAAAGLWGFIYLRSKRLVNENKILEHKIKLRTAEVLEQKEALVAQRDHLEKTLAELQSTQKQLMQSEKMASLGELTAGIAHEIKNPLNFVNNFAEVSIELSEELKEELDKLNLPPENKTYIDGLVADLVQNQQKINFHGKRADSIIKGMLQHSRTSTGQLEPVDINALADEYLRLSYHGLRAKDKSFNAKLETAFDTGLPPINIVPQDIGRVLLNLFTNAFYSVMQKKKNDPGNFQPTVSVSIQRIGNNVEIRVRDNGMGIPQSALDKIYNPFFTTKPTGEGTGLGLSLSYDIITKGHGGSLRAETTEGEFAEFILLLPLRQAT